MSFHELNHMIIFCIMKINSVFRYIVSNYINTKLMKQEYNNKSIILIQVLYKKKN